VIYWVASAHWMHITMATIRKNVHTKNGMFFLIIAHSLGGPFHLRLTVVSPSVR
jgi:hypothetical protein